jgi:iron complex transport system ATP-binding protein
MVSRLSKLTQDPLSPVTVLVTHHVEEIPPGVTHALLLKDGSLVASGAIDEVLTSETLSQVFALPIVIDNRDQRWFARLGE